jgi:ABC-type multidrug transport system permease subunit
LYEKNTKGEHIVTINDVPLFSNGRDFEVTVLGGNFTQGTFCHMIECNTSTQAGGIERCFEVTYTGEKIDTSQSILYIPLFAMIIFTFIMILFFINKLPSSNQRDEEGKILSVTYLKYLRSPLWFFEYMLFVAILYLSSNLAFAYLYETLFAQILFVLFRISFGLAPVIVIVWIIWIYAKMFQDKQFQDMINRGIFPQGKL